MPHGDWEHTCTNPTANLTTSIPLAPEVWGGKANTCIGKQSAYFRGAMIHAGQRGLRPGQEIFIPYGNTYKITLPEASPDRHGWYYSRKRYDRPLPPLGGVEGTTAAACVFQHFIGVSAPT